jgi:hypothetical protein
MDSETQRAISALIQAVAFVIADARAETETLLQQFIAQGVRPERLGQIRTAVQAEVLPRLQAEANKELNLLYLQYIESHK